jgi:hypothetical protein
VRMADTLGRGIARSTVSEWLHSGWVIVLITAIGPLSLATAYDYLGGYATGLALFALITAARAVVELACQPPAVLSGHLLRDSAGTPP